MTMTLAPTTLVLHTWRPSMQAGRPRRWNSRPVGLLPPESFFVSRKLTMWTNLILCTYPPPLQYHHPELPRQPEAARLAARHHLRRPQGDLRSVGDPRRQDPAGQVPQHPLVRPQRPRHGQGHAGYSPGEERAPHLDEVSHHHPVESRQVPAGELVPHVAGLAVVPRRPA